MRVWAVLLAPCVLEIRNEFALSPLRQVQIALINHIMRVFDVL